MWKQFTTRYLIGPAGRSPRGIGIVAACVPVVVGLIGLLTGQAYFFVNPQLQRIRGTPPLHWVEGYAAVLGALFYICLGLYLHFAYYWSQKPRLEAWSPLLANIALLSGLVLGCWGAIAGG